MGPCRTRSETGSHNHMRQSTTLQNRKKEGWRSIDFDYSIISKLGIHKMRLLDNSCTLLASVVRMMDVLAYYLAPLAHIPVERADLSEAWCSDRRLISRLTPLLLHDPLCTPLILNTAHTPHSDAHPARH